MKVASVKAATVGALEPEKSSMEEECEEGEDGEEEQPKETDHLTDAESLAE